MGRTRAARTPAELGGPPASFDEFVAASSRRLLGTAYLLVGDRGHAEDLLQVCLLRTSRRWKVAKVAPEAYARRVLVNLSRDRLRHRSRRPAEVAPLGGAADGDGMPAAPSDIDRVPDRQALGALLQRLPDSQREILVLRYFLDLSVADTAAALGIAEGTVKSTASRALSRLREWLCADSVSTCQPITTQGGTP